MAPSSPPDLIGLLVLLFAAVASQEIANATAAYVAIMALATAGAMLALTGSEQKRTVAQNIGFVAVRVLVATVLTVSAAELAQHVAPWAKPRYTMIPIAFLIGWTADFNSVRSWIGGLIGRFFDKRV
ncbi:MAG: hypothetical protein ACRCV9_00880 [Burkholderiaceae bacterium]